MARFSARALWTVPLVIILQLLLVGTSFGQISIPSGGLPYSYGNNFNSYNPTASTTAGSSIGSGWVLTSTSAAYQGRSTGSGSTGGFYGFGVNPDYSAGALRSGSVVHTYSVSFTNNSGSTITSLTVGWNYEQWRFVNTSGWNLSGTGALAGNTTIDALDFAGVASGTNGTVATTARSAEITVSIANGATFGFSWSTTDATGSDNGVAIDDFTLSDRKSVV